MRRTSPASGSTRIEFDLVKVNRIREQLRRGSYRVDVDAVAEQLVAEHLLIATLLDPAFHDEP